MPTPSSGAPIVLANLPGLDRRCLSRKRPRYAIYRWGDGREQDYLSSAGTGFAAVTPSARNKVSDTAFPIAW